ncbi:hypothetical protein B0H17DRAFT_601908 [Mycena rosella]|uniref:Uncharacterized protein n=1 Tax=Mycena rosella TaxID=1033263 RepID=A0AAD7DHK6_MYCRO|nr:hypothetical protein B0H17DRAFT_601908 [Mycena rosella]
MLPFSSPLLHTLKLNVQYFSHDEEAFPFSAYPDLIAAINTIHLPVLTTLALSEDFDTEEGRGEDSFFSSDFSAFLARHPTLLDLTLNVSGTNLTNDISFLPLLRSFKGSFQDSAIICGGRRQLHKLVVTFLHPFTSFDRPSFHTFPLPSQLSLTHLHVTAVDTRGEVLKTIDELSSGSFAHLVVSFPNVTHLDVRINGLITEYCRDLTLLTKLQSVRFVEYRKTRRVGTAQELFPPTDYDEAFGTFLPFLPQLAWIEICMLVDKLEGREEYSDSEFNSDEEYDLMGERPHMQADYCFTVIRKNGGVNAQIL